MPLFDKQAQFLSDFKSKNYLWMLYGGGVGGGKSVLQIGILDQLATDYPGTKYAIIRRTRVNLKRTSVETFHKLQRDLNLTDIRVDGNLEGFYPNGSRVIFVEADTSRDPDLNKIRGLEATCALIEEANEVDSAVFDILPTRVGRWMNKEYGIPPYILLNCNPSRNWVKDKFYDPWAAGTLKPPFYFLQALPADNPHLDAGYIESLEHLPRSEYERLALGNWDYAEEPDQLISYLSIRDCLTTTTFEESVYETKYQNKIYLGVDVARMGNDRTVFAFFVGNKLLKIEEFTKLRGPDIARLIAERMAKFKIPKRNVAIDSVGLGAGPIDSLIELGYHVISYGSAETKKIPSDNPVITFRNLRDSAHWSLRDDFLNKKVEVINNPNFIREATNICYRINPRSGNVEIEDKIQFKKRMHFSPDYLDAVVIANYVRRMGSAGPISDKILIGGNLQSEAIWN